MHTRRLLLSSLSRRGRVEPADGRGDWRSPADPRQSACRSCARPVTDDASPAWYSGMPGGRPLAAPPRGPGEVEPDWRLAGLGPHQLPRAVGALVVLREPQPQTVTCVVPGVEIDHHALGTQSVASAAPSTCTSRMRRRCPLPEITDFRRSCAKYTSSAPVTFGVQLRRNFGQG